MNQTIGLSPKEQLMYEMIQKILQDGLPVRTAATRLGCSERTVRRNLELYLKSGASALAHKGRGRAARNQTSAETRSLIISLYRDTYAGYNFTHFHQKLTEVEGVDISYGALYAILDAAGCRSPRAQRTRRSEVLHPLRKRRSAFGELVQLDASKHVWFGDAVSHLHLAIDDATSEVIGAHFAEQETLKGYFEVFAQILRNFGVPEELYTDRRTVFVSRNTTCTHLEKDSTTQFRLAAAKLGVLEIHASSVPQAKGRVERAFQTFQDRLISEMRTASISSIAKANAFLPAFVKDHNARYALDHSDLPNVFAEGPKTDREIALALSVVKERTVLPGSSVSIKSKQYAPFSKKQRILLGPGKKVYVLQTLTDELYLVDGENMWPLICIETMSIPTPEELKDNLYIPPQDHPWKEASYQMLLKKLGRAS